MPLTCWLHPSWLQITTMCPRTLSQVCVDHFCLYLRRGTVKPIPSWTFTKNSSGAYGLWALNKRGRDEQMSRTMIYLAHEINRLAPQKMMSSGWNLVGTFDKLGRMIHSLIVPWLSPRWIHSHQKQHAAQHSSLKKAHSTEKTPNEIKWSLIMTSQQINPFHVCNNSQFPIHPCVSRYVSSVFLVTKKTDTLPNAPER